MTTETTPHVTVVTIKCKDTSTICPVGGIPAELSDIKSGSKLIIRNSKLNRTMSVIVSGVTAYQMYTKGYNLHDVLEGASKSNPVEVDLMIEVTSG